MKKIVYIVFAILLLVVSCKKQVTCSNNEIVYTTKYGYPIEFEASEGFGGHVVSNIYEGGYGRITFDNDVVNIPLRAFEGCETLTSIILPECLTGIERYAFSGCINLAEFKGKFAADGGRCWIRDNTIIAYAEASGTEYVIPDSVTTIGDCAFCDCTSITSITIPESVTTIGDFAFASCHSLTSVTIPDSVTTIGERAFNGCGSLTSVTIGDSVTTIGEYAFYYCRSLTSVYCKATTPPSISSDVFGYNANSRKIYVPTASVNDYKSASGWRYYANYIVGYDFEKGEVAPEGQRNNEIWYTSDDGQIIEPSRANVFGASVISNTCEDGKGVITFDGAVTTIGDYAFAGCDSLTSVTIPDSVTSIGNYAFYNCVSLTSVTIPDSVTTIGNSAFYYCDSLTSVTIGDSVTTIGDSALSGCAALKVVYCKPTTPPTMGGSVFAIVPLEAICVPTASVDAYKDTEGWIRYSDIIYGYDF